MSSVKIMDGTIIIGIVTFVIHRRLPMPELKRSHHDGSSSLSGSTHGAF